MPSVTTNGDLSVSTMGAGSHAASVAAGEGLKRWSRVVSEKGSNRLAGALTRVRIRGRHLWVRGWVAAPEGHPITGFRVAAGRAELPLVSWRHGLVDKQAGRRIGAENCGFELQAELPEGGDVLLGSLIRVVPVVHGRSRWSMFAIPRPTLPLPDTRDSSLVGHSFLPEACAGLQLLVNDARLAPDDSVLDIGSGVGRMAYVLAHYLSRVGRYEGLEPVSRWVRWSTQILGARFPNFRFSGFPVRNRLYNPTGTLAADRVRFPFPDGSFDVALALSVFQHNDAAVLRRYLREAARVLRPGGRLLVTCFLLPDDAAGAERSRLRFSHRLEDCWTANAASPEIGIAFRAADFRRWAARYGFSIRRRVKGRWHGGHHAALFQDLVVLAKPVRLPHERRAGTAGAGGSTGRKTVRRRADSRRMVGR